jgi:integrase
MINDRPPPRRVTEDCFASLIRLFMSPANPKWAKYADATRDLWGRELRFVERPDVLGAVSLQAIRPALIQACLDGLDGRPGKQAALKAALVQLEKWAIVRDLLPRPILTGVETESPQGGHIPWTDEQVALAERCARPDIARAITLGANTGQRGSDLIRMGPTDLELFQGIEGINVTQKKTRREVWVPITSPLAAAMATWERRPGPYLTAPDGSAWTRKQLTKAWTYERDRNPALAPLKAAGLVLHGLRGTACVRLRRAGATPAQIADMVGMSEPMVARYCRFSAQRENAVAAVIHLERTIRERNSDKSTGAA